MNTNHNRIKVADLEKNKPNKILKTNQNGELEFTDTSNSQSENYNALDCITKGKTLDARQGKVLKDMIDNSSVNLASDLETQINTSVPEDIKVVSRSKLFNWWEWIKSMPIFLRNTLNLSAGTSVVPGLVIPNGTLTTVPVNGAIERDSSGILWETHNGVRNQLIPTRFSKNISPYTGTNIFISYNSVSGDVIPAGTSQGSGKIYPAYMKTMTNINVNDYIESSFVIYKQSAPATANYVFRLEFWTTSSSGGNPAVNSTYNYTWDVVANPVLSIKIIHNKTSGTALYFYSNYLVFINGIFVYGTPNIISYSASSDCRMFLVNNNSGTNNIVFNQYQAANLFIPIANSI